MSLRKVVGIGVLAIASVPLYWTVEVRLLVDAVHSAYLRALNGGERSSLGRQGQSAKLRV